MASFADTTMTDGRKKKYFIVRVHGRHNTIKRGKETQIDYTPEEREFINDNLKIIKVTPFGQVCKNSSGTWKAIWNFADSHPVAFKNMFNTTDGAEIRSQLRSVLTFKGAKKGDTIDISIGPPSKKWFFSYGDFSGALGIFDINLPKGKIRNKIITSVNNKKSLPSTVKGRKYRQYMPGNLLELATISRNNNKIFNIIIFSCRNDASVSNTDDSMVGSIGEGLLNLDINADKRDRGELGGGKRRKKSKKRRRKTKKKRKGKTKKKRKRKTKRRRKRK